MPAPYRKASRHTAIWVFLMLGGTALGVAAASQLPKDDVWWKYMLAVTAPVALAVAAAFMITNGINRRRIEAIDKELSKRGFNVKRSPEDEQKRAFYTPISYLADWFGWRGGAGGIEWLAASQECGVFEHIYVSGSGKHAQEHLHTVALFPLPAYLSEGFIAKRVGWGAIGRVRSSGHEVEIGIGDFDRKWDLSGNSDLGKGFLTSGVRNLLADSPVGESWMVGGGYFCAAYKATFDAENLAKFLDRAEKVWQAHVNS